MISNIILKVNKVCYQCFDSLNDSKILLTEKSMEIVKKKKCKKDLLLCHPEIFVHILR